MYSKCKVNNKNRIPRNTPFIKYIKDANKCIRHGCFQTILLSHCVYAYIMYILYLCIINYTGYATALNIKRKNIDLPVETLQKPIMAVAQGKSLKNFIETILISKADTINIEVSENPSPSGYT